MSSLPTGTVSLLFSDIEGSTALLRRLGAAYADALDGQRRVLRQAWADHGGTELGTEGDSFYVVFPTAEAAVAAAAQGQRDLAGFEWPGGEQVRVRMGIHTGSPAVHDGAYVGMDVHRAARIAGAAHGGQVLLSSATAELVTECLPEQVTVKDLGSHQLKDIANPEHLFQLAVEGLRREFPPPKTLGTTSSLPRPATPLVGRDGELAELTALLASPEVRLVTLTGPGGSGKTRLAIGVAERLVDRFPDGVYFVALAAATTADVMWTSIAEVLDVPPEGRIPPGFFDHVAHRTALFVLDNLEQIPDAGTVVAELLDQAGQVVVVATSRRPLAVTAEHVHPVPPLELPEDGGLEQAQASGAVQLFVQHARKVKPSFALTADNAADVSQLCRRLDGLPLAIELAAARVRLLTPKALVTRLDQALDIQGIAADQPRRQKTLRDTIAWSYDLLNPQQQMFFRHLGVFAGGADLDAIKAVVPEELVQEVDAFELIADLVDASLLVIGEDEQGEPRIGLLQTILSFALSQLTEAAQVDEARSRHAQYFADLAAELEPAMETSRERVCRRFEADRDNFREAMTWCLTSPEEDSTRVTLGLQLVADFAGLAIHVGYIAESQAWLERAVAIGSEADGEHAICLARLAQMAYIRGDYGSIDDLATRSLAISERHGDEENAMRSMGMLAASAEIHNDSDRARSLVEDIVYRARRADNLTFLVEGLSQLCEMELRGGNFRGAKELLGEVERLCESSGDIWGTVWVSQVEAELAWKQGDIEGLWEDLINQIPTVLRLADPALTIGFAETLILTAGERNPRYTVELLGAVDAMRQREGRPRDPMTNADLGPRLERLRQRVAADSMREHQGTPRDPMQQESIEEAYSKARVNTTRDEWDREYQAGRNMTVEDALTQAHAATADKADDAS